MKSLITLFLIFNATLAFAGASNIDLLCSSGSGRTKIEAYVPGDMTDAILTLKVDNAKVTYLNQEAITTAEINNLPIPEGKVSEIETLDKIEKKAYSLLVKTNVDGYSTRALTLIALPDSVKVKGSTASLNATFKALLTGLDPRTEAGYLPEITLDCSYSYSL